ncbi:MAG: pyridoxamine 5'-phosphate oxidase family protein [Hyphomicrobiales bacterium]|nr:pyridoxamine 5'-phosphate oxidase family protein [Hyphomicrobiales bacterium]
MAKVLPSIDAGLRDFIARQRIFFAASAAPGARVNVSPRGTAAFRVLDEHTVCWLDRTGSGAETAAHLKADGRLTLMFCAFEGPPNVLRLYGRSESLKRGSEAYCALLAAAYGGVEPPGARQIVRLRVERVQTSCGYGVPRFEYRGERPSLDNWALAKGEAGMAAYWREKNAVSIDGLPTGLGDAGGDEPPGAHFAVDSRA